VTIVVAVACLPAVPASVRAQTGSVHTVDLPGGVEGIRRAIGDRRATPPATVGVEITRRLHGNTTLVAGDDPLLAKLRAWLRTCESGPTCGTSDLRPDRVPLPGGPAFWRDVVFEGRVREPHVPLAVLARRDAAILYTALLSMREEVRAWLLARPALVRELRGDDAAALLVAAPFLRLEGDTWVWPGGAAAAPVWHALAGVDAPQPEAALVALLRAESGLLAYLLEVVDTLTPEAQGAVLALGAAEPERVAAGHALLAGVRTAVRGWSIRQRPFWRPSHDPAFLFAQIGVTRQGTLAVPAGRAFWDLVFADGQVVVAPDAAQAAWNDPTVVTAGWIADRVWSALPLDQPARYDQVLFAARRFAGARPADAAAVATVLRAVARYPQLTRLLDRHDAADPARLAALVRRADALAQAGSDWRARGAVVRWQAGLALADYAARLGSLEPPELAKVLDGLAAAPAAAASRGARLRALLGALGIRDAAGDVHQRSIEQALVARITRSRLAAGRTITWEGERYRLEFGDAERDRLDRVRGRDVLPHLDAAWVAYALADGTLTPPDPRAALTAVTQAVRLARAPAIDEAFGREARAAAATAARLLARGGRPDTGEARAALEDLGDALASEALGELAYATAMGWAEDLPLTAMAAFRRHGFSRPSPVGTIDASWRGPEVGAARGVPWHVTGSLLGLDDALGGVALRRPSLRALKAAPSLNTGDRRWLLSTVATLDRRAFDDGTQQRLAALIAAGRDRLRTAADPEAVRRAGERAGASPLRQTLAAWLTSVNPAAVPGVFSLSEITRLGLDGAPLPPALHAWGSAHGPISGQLAPGPLPFVPWERYAGRSARLVSCALADLQLSLAVQLAERQLPAVLVPDLMPSATFELVHAAAPRHVDDFEALADHVRGLDAAALDRYLGLLTTAGPLRRAPGGGTATDAGGAADAPAADAEALRFREPADGATITGSTRIVMALDGALPAVTQMTLRVDGRELCTLTRPPWSCAWDAGRDMVEHHLRAVASLADGRRLVANRRTRGLDVHERVDVSAVQVPVIVTDARGRYVRGLTRDQFTLVENGRKQRIDTVIDESLPLELIATIDISGSMEQAMPEVQAAVKRLLSRLRERDTTTLVGFNETIFVLAEREGDASLREAAVEALVPWGGTAFYDAVVRSLDLVGQAAGRRGVIVFSDGDDRHSVGRRDDSLRRIEEGQVAVYTVGFGEGASAQFRGTLQAFAEASGGRAWFPRTVDDLDAAFGAILDELSHQYILSYVSDAPADGSWRSLEIRACDGCRVRAREGYRAADR
jgi:Ca-activated chloride channel family protein